MPKHQPELARIYNVFGLSSNHELSTLLANIENTKRFSDLLHAVEREFFMVPGEPSGEPEDEGAPVDDECLVNCWGSTRAQYIEQFRAALPAAFANSVPDHNTADSGEKWSLSGDNGAWDYDTLSELIKDNYGHGRDSAGPMGGDDDVVIGSTVYRAIECKDDPAGFLPDANQITEIMLDNAASGDAGEWVDAYPSLDKQALLDLEAALKPLKAWARKHCQPDFFTVKGVTPHTITEEEVRAVMGAGEVIE